MTADQVPQAIRQLLAVGLDVSSSAWLLAWAASLALELDHPVHDCVYLALAGQHGARLATSDGRLRRAAERLGLRTWRP
jgi:predicted nucleic acid-binding protein